LVGSDAYQYLAREHLLVSALSTMLKSPREDLVDRVGATVEKLKQAERELTRLKQEAMMANIDDLLGEGSDVAGVRLWTLRAPDGTDGKQLRDIALTGIRKARSDVPAAVLGAAPLWLGLGIIAGLAFLFLLYRLLRTMNEEVIKVVIEMQAKPASQEPAEIEAKV
ncbi:MAG TPA: hypothetical protein PKH51_06655, partial [Candidatus Sumerlaeota bacterium]|nr:hypothetical protein [Candidatus Sumerlaeota bacterium]